MDVISASWYSPGGIAWYENIGAGEFARQRLIKTEGIGVSAFHADDVDGDGDLDVLSSFDNRIAWYENNGAGEFEGPHVVTTEAGGVSALYTADLDGDGDLDALSSSRQHKVLWYENKGAGEFGQQQVINTAASRNASSSTVYADDLDGDGDMDVLSASQLDNKIAWYENSGRGEFGPQQVITTRARIANVYTADLDDDGDPDVLSALFDSNEVAWFENTGAAGFGRPILITTEADAVQSVYAADLDGDGDHDVLAALAPGLGLGLGGGIAWYENSGRGEFGPQKKIAAEGPIEGANSIYVADIDGDSDLDIISGFGNSPILIVYPPL